RCRVILTRPVVSSYGLGQAGYQRGLNADKWVGILSSIYRSFSATSKTLRAIAVAVRLSGLSWLFNQFDPGLRHCISQPPVDRPQRALPCFGERQIEAIVGSNAI